MKITQVYFSGRWWTRLQPPWIKGPRPIVTYTPCNSLADLARS